MTNLLTPDICVIGAGSGGLSTAAAAAAFGVETVLIEKGLMGGDCLNFGCVPSKALIAAAKQAQALRSGAKFGIADIEPDVDFAAVHRHVHHVIAEIAPNDSVERFTALGVRVIQAEARFEDRRTIIAGDVRIRARRFVIATGSSPFVPPIPGLEGVPYLTNESLFDLKRLPSQLIVIGGGPIGMEMAQAHRRLGARVTVIEAMQALGREDPELASVALTRIRAEGVDIREGAKVVSVELRGKTGIRVHVETENGTDAIDGSHLLVAVGRKPNVDGLDLEKARIAFDRKGVTVGANLRTTNRRVYAIGDVAGGLQFTHVAGYHAGVILRPLLFRLPARAKDIIIPRVTYTDPEIAHVGLTEQAARAAGATVQILRWPYSENDRAQAEGKTEGLIKLVAGPKGRILGASIAGASAGELIGFWSLAVSKGLTLRDVAGHVAPYPTLSEIGKRAAVSYYSPGARNPWVRRLVRFLRKFG